MTFKKMQINRYPPRLWALVAPARAGKSTFATQMRGPILPIDADGRFAEVAALVKGDVYQFSSNPADNSNPARIAEILAENMSRSGVATIVIDSLTAIITPLVTQAIQDNDAGINKNRMSSFRAKALAMRQLQDSISRYGCDTLWIYHTQEARDNKANQVTRATIPPTERARLFRSLNLDLAIVENGKRRGVKVVWARRGRAGMVLWDDTARWTGMPEKIERAVYDGLSEAEQEEIETRPRSFPSPEAAINWGLEQGAFNAIQHARNAYDKLKAEHKPGKASEMWALWIADVERRLAEQATNGGTGDLIGPLDFHAPEATQAAQGVQGGEQWRQWSCRSGV